MISPPPSSSGIRGERLILEIFNGGKESHPFGVSNQNVEVPEVAPGKTETVTVTFPASGRSRSLAPTKANHRHARGIIDTSVVIDLERIAPSDLPAELAVSAVTLAELAAGPHATKDPAERARRQDRLQRAESTFDPVPVDGSVARAYGRVYAAVASGGRKARGRRALDLLIAATALAADLPLYTRDPADLGEIAGLVEVIPVKANRPKKSRLCAEVPDIAGRILGAALPPLPVLPASEEKHAAEWIRRPGRSSHRPSRAEHRSSQA